MYFLKWMLMFIVLTSFSVFADALKPTIPVYLEDKLAVMVTADQPEFIIKLKSNATTGYSWFLRDYNPSLIEPVSHTFEAPSNKALMGAPGYELWTFRMKPNGFVVPQQTMIRFNYARPWEADDSSSQLVFKISTNQANRK